MTRWIKGSLLGGVLLLAACQDAAEKAPAKQERVTSPSAAAPDKANTPPAPARKLYVQASTLKLRAAPSKDAPVRGRVEVNYGVDVIGEKDGFARVRVANGKTGWVGANFLGEKRVTRDSALEIAQEAADVKERLTWLQRAAAVASDDTDVLGKLRDTYGEMGNKRAADMVDRLIKRMTRKWYPVPQGFVDEVWVEIQYSDLSDMETVDLPQERWAANGVEPGMELWVLPSVGKAVKGKVIAVRQTVWNECGGDVGVEAKLDVTLPAGVKPLVAVTGTPPASWTRASAAFDGAAAKRAALTWLADNAAAEKTNGTEPVVSAAPRGDVARVQAAFVVGEDEEGMLTRYRIISLEVGAGGAVKKLSDKKREEMFLPYAVAYRDVTGDGRLETITSDGCETAVKTAKGQAFAVSTSRCCGC